MHFIVIQVTLCKICEHGGFSQRQSQIVFWDSKIKNSIRITEGLDNGDSDN